MALPGGQRSRPWGSRVSLSTEPGVSPTGSRPLRVKGHGPWGHGVRPMGSKLSPIELSRGRPYGVSLRGSQPPNPIRSRGHAPGGQRSSPWGQGSSPWGQQSAPWGRVSACMGVTRSPPYSCHGGTAGGSQPPNPTRSRGGAPLGVKGHGAWGSKVRRGAPGGGRRRSSARGR